MPSLHSDPVLPDQALVQGHGRLIRGWGSVKTLLAAN